MEIITLHSLGAINLKIMFTCTKTLSKLPLVLYEILLTGTKRKSGAEAVIGVQTSGFVKPVVKSVSQ